nr:helix-turn-helix transcriptional regulator [Pseudomonas rhodesiae]
MHGFAIALRKTRLQRALTQEDFGIIRSRTYLITLERGLRNVTLEKASDLARRMGTHPLNLIVQTSLLAEPGTDLDSLFERIRTEIGAKPSESAAPFDS